jgi:hypothetical protein
MVYGVVGVKRSEKSQSGLLAHAPWSVMATTDGLSGEVAAVQRV